MTEETKRVCITASGKHGNRAGADDPVSGRRRFIDDPVMPGMLMLRVLA